MNDTLALPWADDALRRVGPALAYDIVAGLRPVGELLDRYGLSPAQAKAVCETPWFRGMVNEARTRWGSEMGALERIRLKAMVALEESLSIPYTIAHNSDVSATARLEAMKTMERLAGVVPPTPEGAGAAGGGSKFAITINLGDGHSVTASLTDASATATTREVLDQTQLNLTPEVSTPARGVTRSVSRVPPEDDEDGENGDGA